MADDDDPAPVAAPDIDHQKMDDANFATGDLAQALGILGLPKFLVRREMKDIEGFYLENVAKNVLGRVLLVQNGGWAVQGPQRETLAMVWRQHTEDHHAETLSSLLHRGFHRYEQAVKDEQNASIYCLANLDRTVRMFVTFRGSDAVLDAPSNRPVLKMGPGASHGDVQILDAFDEGVANIHTEGLAYAEVHEVTLEEAEDPFPVALFALTLALEMGFRHGTWRSPYQHTEL